MRALLVEDEDAIGMGFTYSLEKEWYEVVTAITAEEARSAWEGREVCYLLPGCQSSGRQRL